MSRRALVLALDGLLLTGLPAVSVAAAAIMGTVRDAASGEPLPDATVWLEIVEGGCPTTRVETGGDGTYVFAPLLPGRYRVRASQRGYVARYHGEGGEPSFGREIVVMPEERRRADLELPPAAEVSGHVNDADGRPLARGYVFFDNLSFTNRSFHTMTDGEGYYWVADLPPGHYRISARRFSPGARQVVGERWFHPGTTEERRSEVVSLVPGQPVQADISFGREPAPNWSVRVEGASGEPVARAEVALRRLDGKGEPPLTCRTDEHGRCSRRLVAGEYEAFVASAPAPYGAGGGEAARARRFRVEGGRTTLSEFRLGAGLALAGAFRARDGGEPPAEHGVRLTLTRPLPGSRHSTGPRVDARPDGDAGFVFEGLASGLAYRLEASSRDPLRRYCVSAVDGGDALLDSLRVRLSEESAATVSVELSPCAVLAGRARAGPVVLRRVGGPLLPLPLHPVEQHVEPTDGRFAFRGLPSGRYVIERPGAAPMDLRLEPGEVRELPTPR